MDRPQVDRPDEMASTDSAALRKPYQAALNDDWESLKDFYKNNVSLLLFPVTPAGDNAFHLAVFSKSSEPLQSLLDLSKGDDLIKYRYLEKNRYGNTPLHEAAANGNLKAVMALVNHNSELLKEINVVENENEFLAAVNKKGETPLFKAAAFGKIEVVKYLSSKSLKTETRYIEGERREVRKLKDVHCQNKRSMPGVTEKEGMQKVPDDSILHVAITGNHFETALYLLNLDESLATIKDRNGLRPLNILTTMPSAFESGYRWGTWIHRVFYFCDDADNGKKAITKISKGWLIFLRKICALVSSNILEKKRNHKLALKLAERLIEKNSSWELAPDSQFQEDQLMPLTRDAGDNKPAALLQAAEKGIVEIVDRILKVSPQLVEQENNLNQNILHVAIKHRQYDIFKRVKNMKTPMTRLVRKVDRYGYTILHHAAIMEPENTKSHPAGPVFQLQEEIKWYKRVEKITPTYYAMLHDEKESKTCEELFNLKHNDLLGKAQQWIKDTSQSCFAVATLVATVVFAAAYTVPGGSNEKGYPIFLNNSLFLLFTIMDVIALASSLTSVVMFLSILTSPYTYDEFRLELPRKITIGFSLLFISLTTTMIVFAVAVALLLIVPSEKSHWTTTLIYTAAFFPVSIFALTIFPMYAAFEKTFLKLYRRLSKNRCVKKPAPPKKPASGQGSIADHNKPCLQV